MTFDVIDWMDLNDWFFCHFGLLFILYFYSFMKIICWSLDWETRLYPALPKISVIISTVIFCSKNWSVSKFFTKFNPKMYRIGRYGNNFSSIELHLKFTLTTAPQISNGGNDNINDKSLTTISVPWCFFFENSSAVFGFSNNNQS